MYTHAVKETNDWMQ